MNDVESRMIRSVHWNAFEILEASSVLPWDTAGQSPVNREAPRISIPIVKIEEFATDCLSSTPMTAAAQGMAKLHCLEFFQALQFCTAGEGRAAVTEGG